MAELYRRSSQYRQWSFTVEQLSELENKVNGLTDSASSLRLSCEEERQLVLFFASDRIKGFCEYFRLPSQVRATSVAYFRRFYLVHSVMEYDPKLVLPTSVFLAAKSENFFIPIAQFAEALSDIEPQQILDLEFLLFQSLGFTLTVHNALRPLHGFFLDMQASGDFDASLLGSMHDAAKQIVVQCFANDAIFLYTPSHIALAALMEANELVVTQYMAQSMDGPNKSLDDLLAIVEQCRDQLRLGTQVTLPKDELKQIAKRLKQYFAERTSSNGGEHDGPAEHDDGPQRKKAKH